ncbi:MAG: branched-chain amino acid ABC transporter permease [Anaerolineales bacterium]|nr:branched-chain amino acid ABC transporter permease [Anaerolineales bacterium]MCB9142005.1 branched-chain amino acid ABC transporter permease [Anaerolineales bacterium]MCO5242869.1 branched-chain amino acid ABC transporter permease [Anaerolineae bacterium]
MFDQLIVSVTDGMLIGVVYGLAAMGLTLIFGVMNVINLAHGPIMALGMFGVYLCYTVLGLNPFVGLIIVAVLGMLLGMIIYAGAVHRVIDAPHLSSLLSTFSVNMMIIGIGTAVFSTSFRNVNYSLGTVVIGPITVPGTRLSSAILALMVTGLLYLFLYRTRPGKYIRAVANNRTSAGLVGIPSTRVLAMSFGIGTALAAVAGGLIAMALPFTILSGGAFELKSFVIVVLGGLGNPIGALLGGIILGLIEGLVPVFTKVTWVPFIEFVLFILILLVRPQGLFGAKQ